MELEFSAPSWTLETSYRGGKAGAKGGRPRYDRWCFGVHRCLQENLVCLVFTPGSRCSAVASEHAFIRSTWHRWAAGSLPFGMTLRLYPSNRLRIWDHLITEYRIDRGPKYILSSDLSRGRRFSKWPSFCRANSLPWPFSAVHGSAWWMSLCVYACCRLEWAQCLCPFLK